MKRIIIAIAALTVTTNAYALDCTFYGPKNPMKVKTGVTTEEYVQWARCPDGAALFNPKCSVIGGDADATPEQVSYRTVKCDWSGYEIQNEIDDADGNFDHYEGTGTFSYDVQIEGMCCK